MRTDNLQPGFVLRHAAIGVLSLMAGLALSILVITKAEVPEAFKQVAAHDRINNTTTLGPYNLPGQYWKSITTFNQLASPTDSIVATGTMQHLVRIDPDDPVPGPPVPWALAFTCGQTAQAQYQAFYKIVDHGQGFDAVISALGVETDFIRHIFSYANIQAGRHYRNSIMDQLRGFYAPLEDEIDAGNLTVLVLDRDTANGTLLIGLTKIIKGQIRGGRIIVGPHGSIPGFILQALPSGDTWDDVEGNGSSLTIENPTFLLPHIADLSNGDIVVEVDYSNGTDRTVRGNLRPVHREVSSSTVTVTLGEILNGDPSDCQDLDGRLLRLISDTQSLATEVVFSAPIDVPGHATIKVASSAGRLGLAQAYWWLGENGMWMPAGGNICSPEITDHEVPSPVATANPGVATARVMWFPINDEDPAQDGWLIAIDRLAIGLLPVD